ncbi:relaxase/mobilization nuclease domain-containing protein [Campylobacter sp. RM12642]|uniref:TraI/MobA(P) family conjugative relaxase n=4 Tax=Campylobacter TaxID=194 RepID=UPI0030143D00|nr:relaxase/mobilization nuclease domain-containing protein [Campylobacter sp. RM12642]MBZ7990060.1 relaxase/mobilization nuclease domain-containing protein [Campylobacter sp. RM12635]
MIIKKVIFKKQNKSSFKNLANYILDRDDKKLFNYIVDKEHKENDKVESFKFSNCSFDDIDDNIFEILNTQILNTITKQDKTMHLIVSFKEDEKPKKEILDDIENEIVAVLCMKEHQRVSAVHTNTNNLHMHIAINKVNPITYKVINPYNDVKILQNLAIKLEKKHKLQKDNHISNKDLNKNIYNKHTMSTGFNEWVKNKLENKVEDVLNNENATFNDIVKLLFDYDLEIKERRNGYTISSKNEKLFCKASFVHRQLSKQQLLKRFGPIDLNIQNENINNDNKIKFKKEPIQPIAKTSNLWQEYIQYESENKSKLDYNLSQIKIKREKIKKSFKGCNKFTFYKLKKELEDLNQEQKNTYKKHKKISWKDFLISKALENNEEAIKILSKKQIIPDKDDNTISSELNNRKVFKDIKCISNDGFIVYENKQSKMIDKGDFLKLKVDIKDKDFILDSLLKSMERFGRVLDINGSDDFKKIILDVANEYNLDIEFKDIAMDKIHKSNQSHKQILKTKNTLLRIVDLQIKNINKNDSIDNNKKEKIIKSFNKTKEKLLNNNATFFAGEFKKLGFDYNDIDSFETYEVNIQIDGFKVNDINNNGLKAMNNYLLNNIKDKEEFKKINKFVSIFEKLDKIVDVAKGFYENKKVDVDEFINKYNMQLEKLDKKANAIKLDSELNIKIIDDMYHKLKKQSKYDLKVEIIESNDINFNDF